MGLVASIFFVLLMFRLRGSILRITPDPGFSIFYGVRREKFGNLFSFGNGYFNLLERIVARIVVAFPIEFTALISSLLTSLIWIFTAVAITAIAKSVKTVMTSKICESNP